MIKINTRATEDIITEQFVPKAQQLWDEAIEKGTPLYSPKEIAEVFPDLNKDSQRQALLRVAGKQKTEEGEHVRALIAFTNRVRAADDYNDCWHIFTTDCFPDAPKKLRRQYFIDIYTMWCYPSRVSGDTIEEYIKSSAGNKYLSMIYRDLEGLTVDDLEELGQNFMKLQKDAQAKDDQDELDDLDTAITFIEVIQDIMDGEYLLAWGTLNDTLCSLYKDEDSAPTMLELMRIFYKG
ncbi:MAG: hypothetical protein NC218_01725 [Acetobacter sp.]|nr:hypothetical protein [Acetobacter sp.]